MLNNMTRRDFMKGMLAGGVAACSAGLLTACGSASSATSSSTSSGSSGSTASDSVSEPVTLTFFDKNTSAGFDDPVARTITETTGVQIEIQQPTGNPDEKLVLMLSGNELPDIVLMDRRSDIVNQYIEAGALIPLNDLIDQYGSNIKEMYGETLNLSRYQDGQNYYLNNWYGVDPTPDRAVNIRMDLLKELGYGEKAEQGDYFTQEEFVEMLREFKEKYPTIDGKETIPFTVNGEYMDTVLSTFRGMYGMKNYYINEDDEVFFQVRDPRYLEMMQFINQLYTEDLLDNEWATTKSDLFDEKLASGVVFACNDGTPSSVNYAFQSEEDADPDRQFYMFRVVADGVDPDATTFSPRSSLGWDAIGITSSNEYPVETIKLLDFLASEDGQYLLMWGVEGKDWTIENGVHVPSEETLPGFRDDWNGYSSETGIRKWTWCIKNGYGSDGTPYDLVTQYELDEVEQHARISMEGSVWDTAPYDDIAPQSGTLDALAEQKCTDIIDQYFAKMAYASSSEEVAAFYEQMIAEIDANDAASVEQIYTEKYQANLELWAD
ncbi:MAG: substrate-binding domain-containing protein [Lachnospiraceae bacterium]|nr:substrate-binding domain-containing protein [Lachnospiraceae bacterium]